MNKSKIGTIAGKELYRFFHDRGLITSLLLPAIILYMTYSFIIPGFAAQSQKLKAPAQLFVIDLPGALDSQITSLDARITTGTDAQRSVFEGKLKENEDAVLLVFPRNFAEKVAGYDAASGGAAPNVEIYYKSVSSAGSALYSEIISALDQYESSMSNKFDVNRGVTYDLSSKREVTGQIFSQLLPMLMLIFLFTGCMSFAPDSIAGEKERGTMATLLVTPIHRYEIVVGKILAFSGIAILSGGLTFLAVSASLPNLVSAQGAPNVEFTGYAGRDYGMLLLVIVTTALFMISMVSLISAIAKTTKQATSMVSPLMVIVMFAAFSTLAGNGTATAERALYCIPIYNSVQAMTGIFAYHYDAANIVLCSVTNLICSGLVVFGIVKLFSNERVMFGK